MTPTDPDTWPTKTAAAAALGLTPRRLSAILAAGAPAPESGPIPQAPLLAWLWQHRDDPAVIGRRPKASAAEREQLEIERLKLGNARLSGRMLADAQRAVARTLNAARDGARSALNGPALHRLHQAAQGPASTAGPRLAAAVMDLYDRCLRQALR